MLIIVTKVLDTRPWALGHLRFPMPLMQSSPRTPEESDETFLARCDLPSDPRALKIASAVRRPIAQFADLGVESIHAEDRIPEDLGDIFLRESPIVVEFLITLESELGLHVPDSAGYFASRETIRVKDIVNEVYKALT